jgi:hypothetical protein
MSPSSPIHRPQPFRGLSLDAIFFFLRIHDNKVLLCQVLRVECASVRSRGADRSAV